MYEKSNGDWFEFSYSLKKKVKPVLLREGPLLFVRGKGGGQLSGTFF